MSLISLEDCCFAVTSSSSDKLSSITSCCKTQCNYISSSVASSLLFSSTSSTISLLYTSSSRILAKSSISLTIGSTGATSETPRCYILGNTLRPKFLPSRSEGSLGNPFPFIVDRFEAGNDVEVIFLKFSESKFGP
ncbi:hypothetical protein AVEN_128195-1 [Araneus ventricosus]|uniref:Uncharacterized protein n=1 Tax=Araneus ventricosus TaxID=182803 RepID=A0A4Y1ZZX4_ARAVE|nr:hypothetical protein AVEN_128195-1 [Araneus ventricosus]